MGVGRQMDFLKTQEEKAELKAELAALIETAVANGITDLEKLKDKWQRDLESGKATARLEAAMRTNGRLAKYRHGRKVDQLVDSFFNQTLASRERTHFLATQDAERQRQEELEKKQKKATKKTQSWAKTSDAWDKDDWDEW